MRLRNQHHSNQSLGTARKLRAASVQFTEQLESRVMLSTGTGNALAVPDPTGISSVLQRAAAGQNTGLPASGPGSLMFDSDGRVAVEISTTNVAALAAPLAALGFNEISSFPAQHFIDGYLPLSAVASMNDLTAQGLMGLMPEYHPMTFAGTVDSQGDSDLEADRLRNLSGNTGTGVTVGVLSDSYNDLGTAPASVSSGNLPNNVNVLQDLASGGEDEGRGMLEIVHDLAPGANLAFATADVSEGQFANNIVNLAKPVAQGGAGAQVVNDDVAYFDEPYYQDGIVAQGVNTAVTTYGASYFAAAGNIDNQSWEATNVTSGSFVNTTIPAIGTGNFYNFGTVGSPITGQSITLSGGFSAAMQWDQPYYSVSGVTTNLNFFLLYNGAVIASGNANAIANQTPFQFAGVTGTGTVSLVIEDVSGPAPGRIKWVNYSSNNYGNATIQFATNSPTIVPHAGAANAMAVAAAPFYNERATEAFTSEGPTTILFDSAGNRLGSAQVRAKPDITAIDGADTSFFPPGNTDADTDGFPNFFGTSAATPHAAAVAALIKSANPSFTPSQIYTLLKNTADPNILSTQTSSVNVNYTGAGLIDAFRALEGNPVPAAGNVSDGFENGLGTDWSTYNSGAGRTTLQTVGSPATGTFHLVEDANLQYTTNPASVFTQPALEEAILHVNLSGATTASVAFDEKPFADANVTEDNEPMPASFTGHGNYDGVALSVDGGTTWYALDTLPGNGSSVYQHFTNDLVAFAVSKGITLSADTQIKFQHYDNIDLEAPRGGFAFDNVAVASAVSSTPLTLTGKTFYIKKDADGIHGDVYTNTTGTGSPSQQYVIANTSSITVTGTGSNESLTVDFTAGDPLISTGATYNGGVSGNALLIFIGDGSGDTLNVGTGLAALTGNFPGSAPIAYTTLSSLQFVGGNGNDILTQTAAPGATLGFAGGAGSDTLNVNGGTFTFSSDASLTTTNLAVNIGAAGSVQFNSSQHLNGLTLNGGGATLTSNGSFVLVTKGLTVNSGVLDITNNAVVDDYTGGSPVGTIGIALKLGYNNGAWTGQGIKSSTAATTPDRTVGYGEATDLFSVFPATFLGVTIDNTSILIRYTLPGDANLDRSVNVTDLGTLASNWQKSPRRFAQGDFDYSGTVDVTDLGKLATNWQVGIASSDPSFAPVATVPTRTPVRAGDRPANMLASNSAVLT